MHAAGEISRQSAISCCHGGRDISKGQHRPVSEGICREPRIIGSDTGPQKIAKEISFQVTTNEMIVAEQVSPQTR